ncbi:putative transcription factor bHLH041 [Aristolochia californica]|uniref:putative transcription factor bHLH041 n=1 Tax=Aristolochia californica TaxID=171875 RepID=UPI0035DE1D56
MDYIFFLEDEARAALLRVIGRFLGCSYICLWSYSSHSSNFLICKDGWYNEEGTDQRGSSVSEDLVYRLFNAFRGACLVDLDPNSCSFVPGYVSKEGLPYLELRDSELFSLAAIETQRQFYQEARIKVVAFLGCRSGEIELGISTPRNMNLQMEITNLLTEIIQQSQVGELPQSTQSRPSSSSSSLMSLSMGSPENSSLIFSIPTTASYLPNPLNETPIQEATRPTFTMIPHQHSMQAYARNRNVQLPSPASDDAAMTRAILAIISSSSSSSSSYQTNPSRTHQRTGPFRPYMAALRATDQVKTSLQRHNMLKRVFAFLRSIPRSTIEAPVQETRPTANQLHHMISERKRREKLNEYFNMLRGLLPPGIKKHKASVLSSAIETLGSLKAEVSELKKKYTSLQARLEPSKEAAEEVAIGNERVQVEIIAASESSSEEREIELQVTVREDVCNLIDLVIRLLQPLKQMNNVAVISVEAGTQLRESNSFHRTTIRLRIKACDWEEQTFKEAMTRAADGAAS